MQVTLNLDTPEHHPTSAMPRAIRELWYQPRREGLLALISSYGCPHTGGQHKFHFTAERADVVAWLDLFQEAFPNTAPEIMVLKRRIHLAVVHGTNTNSSGDLRLELKAIERQFGYNGEVITRPWFWTPEWEV